MQSHNQSNGRIVGRQSGANLRQIYTEFPFFIIDHRVVQRDQERETWTCLICSAIVWPP